MSSIVQILPMTAADANVLAPEIAAIDPWHRLKIQASIIRAMLAATDPHQIRRTIAIDDRPIGAIVVQPNWLLGPYLKHLSVLPRASGKGAGTEALNWLNALARDNSHSNVWLCVSQFNVRARQFYARNAFVEIAVLDDLVVSGENEVLMRRRLA